jgi:hypothetical protein
MAGTLRSALLSIEIRAGGTHPIRVESSGAGQPLAWRFSCWRKMHRVPREEVWL